MDRDELFEIADRQQGYFTTRQAIACGISQSNFHRKIASGEWAKEERGIYRLVHYPTTERPELVLWALWSCDRGGVPQGVWSHETALDIYDLSDVMPAKMHMTVPKRFRRRKDIPRVLCLYFEELAEQDIEQRQGYRVTTPLRTLLDVVRGGRVSDDLIVQAAQQALQRGLLSRQQLLDAQGREEIDYIIKMLNAHKI